MSDKTYPILETGRDEENLFFSTSTEDQACVGHLRGDFGSGKEFWTTWWDHHEELKDQPFKNELDTLVSTLRKNGPLKDLSSMERFCREHPQSQLSPESGSDYYGFRVDTGKHRFYMRFLPRRGDYNFYIYCYQTDKLERAAPQAREGNAENGSTIRVLVVEPMKPCVVQDIPNRLEAMQGIVGGHIEFASPFPEPLAIICNEEGKVLELPFNRPLCGWDGIPHDILCGTFFVARVDGDRLSSLTDAQIEKLRKLYDNMVVLTAEKPTPQYDLSSAIGIAVSAELARERAAQEPDQTSYNAAWLQGYAKALGDVAEQLDRQQSHKRGPKKAADQNKKRGTNHER